MATGSQRHHRVFYKSLPKVELHRHLEGSLRLSTMIEVARKYALDVPYDNTGLLRPLVQVQNGEPFTHQNFLSKFAKLRLFYQSKEVIQRFTREVIADAAADNIRYMELRFTPVALTRIRDFSMADAIDWVIESTQAAAKDYGVQTRLITSANKHESVELAEEVIDLSIQRAHQGIVAVDLAGAEAEFPGKPFAPHYQKAKAAGLHVTIHAGEWGSAHNVAEAINDLGAQRIGHGVRVMEDEDTIALAKEQQITFEVCPTSNYQSGVVPTIKDHPLKHMLDAGLAVTINTDDPAISQIDLSDEYELACEDLGFSPDQLRQSIRTAAKAAFLPDEERARLVALLDQEFATHKAANGAS